MSSRPSLLLLALLSAPALAAQPVPEALPAPPRFEARVDDPMLAPAPPTPEQVGSWEEALGLLRGRSTDLRSAEAGVERAEGRWRQALSALLPNARATAGVALDILHPENPVVAGGGGLGTVLGGTSGGGQTPTAPLGTASITLTQSLLDVGAWRGVSSARSAEEGAQASLHDVQRRLTWWPAAPSWSRRAGAASRPPPATCPPWACRALPSVSPPTRVSGGGRGGGPVRGARPLRMGLARLPPRSGTSPSSASSPGRGPGP